MKRQLTQKRGSIRRKSRGNHHWPRQETTFVGNLVLVYDHLTLLIALRDVERVKLAPQAKGMK